MDNIKFINQRFAHFCSLISRCKTQSAAAEKRFAKLIITMEIKRIKAYHTLEKQLGDLRAVIPVYNARNFISKHLLSKQINDLNI